MAIDKHRTDELERRPIRELRYAQLGKLLRPILVVSIFALVLWYGTVTAAQLDTPLLLTKIVVVLVAIGITSSIYRVLFGHANDRSHQRLVVAEFLTKHLLEPQKRKQAGARGYTEAREEGYIQGRSEAMADIRARLLQEGINPDRIISPDDANHTDPS